MLLDQSDGLEYGGLVNGLTAEIDLYGADVVAAFGEYCGHRLRVLQGFANRGRIVSPDIVSKMIACIMVGYEGKSLPIPII